MIATVTLNPALDYAVTLAKPLVKGAVNRTAATTLTAGGKGINVAWMLHQLDVETVAHGFLAGATGTMIAAQMRSAGVRTDWLTIPAQENRINCKLAESDGVTEVNGSGLTLSAADCDRMRERLSRYGAADWIVLAGSLPNGVPHTQYADWMQQLQASGTRFAVDTEGAALLAALPYHPFVIKPNLPELCALFSCTVHGWQEAIPYMRQLQTMGAQTVLLSLGGEGAVLLPPDASPIYCPAPVCNACNPVGAGDSMLAGFLAACAAGASPAAALQWGVAAGSATACVPALATAAQVRQMLSAVAKECAHPSVC